MRKGYKCIVLVTAPDLAALEILSVTCKRLSTPLSARGLSYPCRHAFVILLNERAPAIIYSILIFCQTRPPGLYTQCPCAAGYKI